MKYLWRWLKRRDAPKETTICRAHYFGASPHENPCKKCGVLVRFTPKKGQINMGILSLVGTFILAAMGFGWNATLKADRAVEQVSSVREDIAEIKTDIKWIKETLTQKSSASSSRLFSR